MFGQTCVDHGVISLSGDCCPGLTPWAYDANNGVAYNGFGCWNAPCATVGQWAGPGGQGNKCCSGLVNSQGKCAVPVSGGGGPITPLPPVIVPTACKGTFVCDIEDMWIYGGLAAVALLMMMGGKK